MVIKFEFERETKNKIRLKEISDSPIIETLYICKSALPALDYKNGDILCVTLSKEELK